MNRSSCWRFNGRSNKVVTSIPSRNRRGVLDTTLCDKVFQWLATCQWFYPVFSANKIDLHDLYMQHSIMEKMQIIDRCRKYVVNFTCDFQIYFNSLYRYGSKIEGLTSAMVKKTKRPSMIHKTLHRKLNIGRYEPQ